MTPERSGTLQRVEAVEQEHVVGWLAEREAEVMPASHAAVFDAYLNGLPWLGSSPDWASIGATQLRFGTEHFWDELAATRLGRFDHAFLMYAATERGVVGLLRDVIEDVDTLTWGAPGVRFLCGARRDEGEWTIEPAAFAAYDGADRLVVSE